MVAGQEEEHRVPAERVGMPVQVQRDLVSVQITRMSMMQVAEVVGMEEVLAVEVEGVADI
jgi:hypothetical protein